MTAQDRAPVLAFPQAPDAIELRHLRAFVAVAEELNFGRAADRMHISQSALSRQVRGLEQLLGCELLRRSTHRVELTIAGEALLDRARRLLDDVDEAVSATLSIGGELAGRLAQLWAPLLAVADGGADLHARRTAYEQFHAQFAPPPDIVTTPVNAGGVPSLQITAPGRPPTILYLHGGGYIMGSAFGYRPLIGAFAGAAQAAVLAPDFRLAPEHPFPAALEDVTHVYLWMLETGARAEQLVIAGDSSGAGLTMSLLLTLVQRDLPLPGATVLFCPWLDLTGGTLKSGGANQTDIPTLVKQAVTCVDAYLNGHPVEDPILNPLTADLAGLPPMLIQAATGDAQRRDADLLTERARAQGVDARLELYPVDTHAFQTFWSFLPEAMEGLSQAGRFVQDISMSRSASPPVNPRQARQ